MITHSFDNKTEAIIKIETKENAPKVDACIMTFSYVIELFALEHYPCERIATIWCASGPTPVYRLEYKGRSYAFFKNGVGAPLYVGGMEDVRAEVRTDKFILFGGAGCLNKEIARGKVMVPTAAYRDEGTSYHYAPAADWIAVKNAGAVAAFMEEVGLPYVLGKTWTTDAFYRETRGNFERRKADGCVSVEMECAAAQAMCDFYGLQLYAFFTGGDQLDAPKWDARMNKEGHEGTQHDAGHLDIALELADYVTSHD